MERAIKIQTGTQRNLYLILTIVALPLVLSFALPVLFYRIPIGLLVWGEAVQLTGSEILYATAVWLTWIAVAVLIPLMLSRSAPYTTYDGHWKPSTLLCGYIILSLGGAVIAPAQYFIAYPSGIEQLFRQLSLAPVVSVVLGIQVLRTLPQSNFARRPWVIPSVILLLVLNLSNAVILPVLFGRAAPAVLAGLAILFGLHMLKVGVKKLIVGWVIFILLAGLFLAYRENFRTSGLGSAFWNHGQYIRLPVADVVQGRISEAYSRMTGRSDITLDQPPNFGFDWNFSNYDINYRNIRFLPNDKSSEATRYLIARTLHRINKLSELAYAIRVTPETIPYLNGTTYFPLLFKLIPRFLWTDKPVDNSGQLYGHRYGRLDPADKITSANMGVVVEAWINGGWSVIVLSSLAFGVLIYLAWRVFIGESTSIGNVLLGTVFLTNAISTESSMNLVMGGMLYSMLVWWVIEYFIRTKL